MLFRGGGCVLQSPPFYRKIEALILENLSKCILTKRRKGMCCMKELAIFDDKNYGQNANRIKREAVRAVIVKDGAVALVKSLKENHYKFPGGGIEENENHIDTLIRETKEETGLNIRPETVVELGLIREIRKSVYNDDVFEQNSYYYFAEVSDNPESQQLTDAEKELQYVLCWVNPQTAYDVNIKLGQKYRNKFLMREAFVLELIIKHGKSL